MSTLIHFINSDTDHMLIIDEMQKSLVDSGAYISEDSSWKERNLASFYIRPGLANSSFYSFESKVLPGHYLKSYDDGTLYLVSRENNREFSEDATYRESNGALISMSHPNRAIAVASDGTAVSKAIDNPNVSSVVMAQAEKRWKDSYTISFNYFGDKSVHLTLGDDKVGFRSYSFWDDFDQQANTAGWYLDYPDYNTPYFTIRNVGDDQERFLAVADDNTTVELVANGIENGRYSNNILWRAEALSARGQYAIANKKVEAHSKNALRINRSSVDKPNEIEQSLSVLHYDNLSNVSVVLNIDERFIPTQLMLDDVKVANSLLRQQNGLTSMGMIIPLTKHGGADSWSVRRYKTTIEKSTDGSTFRFASHIGSDPEVDAQTPEWIELKDQIMQLPVMEEFTSNEQNLILDIARKHLGKAYRSHVLGEPAEGYTDGIIWLKPDIDDTNILEQVDTFIDYKGQTIRTMSTARGQRNFSAAFGFLLEKEERDGSVSYTIGDPTSGESKPPNQ